MPSLPSLMSPDTVSTPQPLPSSSQAQLPALVEVSAAIVDIAPASTILPVLTPPLVQSAGSPSASSPTPATATPSTTDDTVPEDTSPSSSTPTFLSNELPSQQDSTHDWPPQHTPTWDLGPQHPNYVRPATTFLLGVPGGPEWMRLLERWVVFESLSSSNAVGT